MAVNSHHKVSAEDLELIAETLADADSQALGKLFHKYRPLVLNLISSYRFRYYDFDDLLVEALVVCYESVLEFEPSRQIPFGAFFKANLNNYLMTLLRGQKAQKRQLDKVTSSFEGMLELKGENSFGPDQHSISPEQYLLLKEKLERLPTVLSSLEIEVLQLYCGPFPYSNQSIAEHLSISYPALSNASSRCKYKTIKLLYN
ncbi:DNA-directed RNA polymerase sigma-70 factor [Ligilactobacillus salitolerans]|uniref:DNA-directed RNA polymerase sigma-70 factor n=1 Tax=Ligilactobacillus salitolerans TaxID=1808352 RepID=A0A401IWC7_9LACO|nr:sigma-70 family RNA polymerase sigma factor [Ligilactobacillus salitolerans]GBG95861.1 DNA-directed RNA polymerase sigma-70 factor [Ligilactobacillus salitolerans]